jgi:hypothetical protein
VPAHGAISSVNVTFPALVNPVSFTTTVQSGGSLPAGIPPLNVARARSVSGSRSVASASPTIVPLVFQFFTAAQEATYANANGTEIFYVAQISIAGFPKAFPSKIFCIEDDFYNDAVFGVRCADPNVPANITFGATYFDGSNWHDESQYLTPIFSGQNPDDSIQSVFLGIEYNNSAQPLTFSPGKLYLLEIYAALTPASPVANPSSVAFAATGTTATTSVSESGYSGAFTAPAACVGNNNTTVATVSVGATGTNGSATVTLTSVAAGSCTLAVSDSNGGSVNVPVTVTVTNVGGS